MYYMLYYKIFNKFSKSFTFEVSNKSINKPNSFFFIIRINYNFNKSANPYYFNLITLSYIY